MQYKIEGTPMPVVICTINEGETIVTEKGGMSWMTPNMQMNTNTNGGIGKAFGRMFSGESMFVNKYTCTQGEGLISFASSMPGSIIPFEITPEKTIIAQKTAFLAATDTVELSVFFNKKVAGGFFGGEGFIMQKLHGQGTAFVEIDGYCVEYELQPGQQMIVDTGHLAAMEATVQLDVQMVKGLKNIVFGGEGMFNTVLTGPGKIWLQTMPIPNLAGRIAPYIATGK